MSKSTANMPDMVRDRRARETAAQMAAPAHKYGFDDIVRYCDDSLSSWATVSHFSSSDITEWIAFAEDLKLEKTLAAFESKQAPSSLRGSQPQVDAALLFTWQKHSEKRKS
ncbi:hypothetical protein WJX84_006881 [Apatococcus fuscideae]|uniref:Uncharacterized protein n=1 Tax=Apatococcus fuscideae TaxID=2026836 RepID=A0AAW1T5U6_9CHLO